MSQLVFNKPFTQQEAIPEDGIESAVALLRTGRLHRYNVVGEDSGETALLEQEYAAYMGQPYCLACASGGYAMHIALKAAGLQPGEPVLTNAFTLAPVPGAINNAGGKAVLVEITSNYQVNLQHLEAMMQESSARFFLISHMRGHISDMDRISGLCDKYGVILIEDCAHTMGASWQGKKSGSFGRIGCFSTQTYKHLNSGEGGMLTTNDENIMARAIVYSGSYMLFERHGTVPSAAAMDAIKLETPNYSGRMDNLRATILRAQLPGLDTNCIRWNDRYRRLEKLLQASPDIQLPVRPAEEYYVGSSLQFRIEGFNTEQVIAFLQRCAKRGVELKWFGSAEPQGFTSRYDSWHYLNNQQQLPDTLAILATTFDLRIPLTFEVEDMEVIGQIIIEEAAA